MGGGGELLLYGQWERQAPDDRMWCGRARGDGPERSTAGNSVGRREQHAASAGLGSIMGAVDGRLDRNEFSYACGAVMKVMVYHLKVGQNLMQNRGESDPVGTVVGPKCFLQETEKTTGTWESNGHGTELTKDAVPFFDRNAVLSGRNTV
jgi:hypothetical protein